LAFAAMTATFPARGDSNRYEAIYGPELEGFDYPYPHQVDQLILVNPIGLEDWKSEGEPSLTVDQWYKRELGTTAERIRAYEQATYYADQWRTEYEVPVQMLAGMYRGPRREIVAWNSALIYDMIYTQPVAYEFEQIEMPALLMIGQGDTTAIGKDLAASDVRAALGRDPDLGHAPQMQDPETFHKAL
jgi:pimeloyl-ACP methyl ester carboxylesterase